MGMVCLPNPKFLNMHVAVHRHGTGEGCMEGRQAQAIANHCIRSHVSQNDKYNADIVDWSLKPMSKLCFNVIDVKKHY